MLFGLQVNPHKFGPTGDPWDRLAAVARATDESSFDSLWLYDHFLYEGGYGGHPDPQPVIECFVTLGALSPAPPRIPPRHPPPRLPHPTPPILNTIDPPPH